MKKNYTEVVIDNKVYTVGCEEDKAYMQALASYVNEKLEALKKQPGFMKQPYGTRQTWILMNLADDYLKEHYKCEKIESRYKEQEIEFYNMKREMIDKRLQIEKMSSQMEQLRLQMEQLRLQNQVLSMGLQGNEEEKRKILSEVIERVNEESSDKKMS